ncbi:hypothetical protein QFZ55_007792 [Streptomyces luteogriseus]|nr:hypothetical protein [Streptomyces luteogriseus]
MLGRQGRVVHRVGVQDLGVVGGSDSEREAAPVVLLDTALHAVVRSGEDDVDRVRLHPIPPEEDTQGHPCPFRGADGSDEPRLAHRPRCQQGPAVARAFQGDARVVIAG